MTMTVKVVKISVESYNALLGLGFKVVFVSATNHKKVN